MINTTITRFTARVVFLFTFSISGGRGKIFFLASQQHIGSTPNLVQEARNDVGTCLYRYLIHMRIILCTAGNSIDKIEKIIKKRGYFFLKTTQYTI